MIFAQVAVPVPARAGSLFSYAVPADVPVAQGNLVIVPFSSRLLPGVVVETTSIPPSFPTRPLMGLISGAPLLSLERVEVARWMADYYRAHLFDALSLFLPPGWQRALETLGEGTCRRWSFCWPAPPVSEATMVGLAPGTGARVDREPRRAGVRERVLSFLQSRGPIEASAAAEGARCALGTIGRMVAEGQLVALNPPPDNLSGGDDSPRAALSESQLAAFEPMAAALASHAHQVFLLHGVTGSGKTHIYLRLIQQAVSLGRQAIVLVSEIAQTPEAVERYSELFPGRVALLHSNMRDAVRSEMWRRVSEGRYDVVVGPRSALFAPVPRPGLVVLDEEHEPAYKQDDRAPRYHARDVAIEIGRRYGVPVILGSATPDVVSYHYADRGAYRYSTLPDRYTGPSAHGWSSGILPPVEIVDLRDELRAGNTGILSRSLQSGLGRVLESGEQAILFLNRRGASTCVMCRDCGYVLKCRRCDVAMVFHKDSGLLVCHQCNRTRPQPEKCPQCKKKRIGYFGVGTERVEQEVRRLFPDARVLRWDHDVTGPRDTHARLHQQFRDRQADILVGTQMVAKALDFPMVTLVGVVLADVTLHLPDFRAAERTFQLLAQVAGRAGRGATEGRVVIQTYSPDHYSIVAAAGHDYRSFYDQEIAFRRYHAYPPFRRLALLVLAAAGEVRARFEAIQMRKRLQAKVDELGIGDLDLLGPAPAFHSRLRGKYRWQIVLAGEGLSRLLREIDLPAGWSVNVDPVSLL